MVQRFPVSQKDPPAPHKALVKCINKYGISFEAVDPPVAVLKAMPLWHHPGEDSEKRQENNGQRAECLRINHAALTIGDGLEMAVRLENPEHSTRDICECVECNEDRVEHGCENPHACAKKAASRLGQIHPRWIPRLGDERGETEPTAPDDDSEVFVPPDKITSIAQGLRAMTNRGGEPTERPAPRPRRRGQALPRAQRTVVYIAGVIHTPPGEKSTAAAAFSMEGEVNEQMGKCIPATSDQSQYVAEFFAALAALRSVNENTTLTIYTVEPLRTHTSVNP
ncbi:hypothetical protein GGX14DRAFT_354845 [Mycena pura]|uniref:RNase H type-1 domain-containing protein n=1 Tax=Mycena pura TaxID=153505 RepID=A0AAD6YJT8_9AGAR|nr:hypothetical protein GGX14DRAFT_354845 [Mycena pura]